MSYYRALPGLCFARVRTNMLKTSMPAKPVWYSKLDEILRDLRENPRAFVDRTTVEFLLGVGRRRAQQVMAPCITDHIGANGLANRDLLVAHLQRLAEGEDASHERRRRRRVAGVLEQLRQDRLARPQLLVEAPVGVVNQEFDSLPPGVHVEPGRITVEFEQPQQALERLLALAMAISNDYDRFERRAKAAGSA